MYSVVLMAALTVGNSSPAFGHGCYGGCGGRSCYGGSCFGGSCSGCYGCYGGSGYGYGGSCYGCYGCYGGGGYGYSGSCYGCYGSACNGCSGGGCYGGYGGYVSPYGVRPIVPEPLPKPKPEPEGQASARAKLVVELPKDAKLFIDDQPMKATSEKRTFDTPALEKGHTYYYIVRAEIVRDGETFTDSKRVLIRAGETAQASFVELEAVAARKREVRTASRR